jgi:hypothetical protein
MEECHCSDKIISHKAKNSSTKLKALHNEGDNTPDPLCFNFADSSIHSNLLSVGILLGHDQISVTRSIAKLKHQVSRQKSRIFLVELLVLKHISLIKLIITGHMEQNMVY